MVTLRSIAWVLVAGLLGCVSPPEASRDGGTPCQRDEQCNRGPLCGPVRLCVLGFCAEDTVFRVCGDAAYPDGGPVGECLTYVNCNSATCGALIPCVDGRCDPNAPRLQISCVDGGVPND